MTSSCPAPSRYRPPIGGDSLVHCARRLSRVHLPALRRHLAALSSHDLYLRFGGFRTPESLDDYVASIDFSDSIVLGVFDLDLEVLGVAQVSPHGDGHELGLSVIAPARRRGIGSLLMRRALQHARLNGTRKVYMHCLAANRALIVCAKLAGARVSIAGGEADGIIELLPSTPYSGAVALLEEQIGLFDFGLKAQRRAGRLAAAAFGAFGT